MINKFLNNKTNHSFEYLIFDRKIMEKSFNPDPDQK